MNTLENRFNTGIYILLIIITVGLLVDKFVILIAIILCMICGMLVIKNKKMINRNLFFVISLIIIYTIISSFFTNSIDLLGKEISRNFIYLCLVYAVSNIYVNKKTYILIWSWVIFICMIVQIIQFTKLIPINDFLSDFYGVSEDSAALRVSKYNTLNLFRSGSIFININSYFKIVICSFAIFLNERVNCDVRKDRVLNLIRIILTIASCVFIGSRTCLIVMCICFLEYIFFSIRKDNNKIVMFTALLLLLVIIYLLGGLNFLFSDNANIRMFEIVQEDGSTGSLEHKLLAIKNYWKNSNAFSWLFGRGLYEAKSTAEQMDSDLGYFIAYYGVFGIIFLILIIKEIYIYQKEQSEVQLGVMWCTAIALSVITSGVYFNMRVFGSLIVMMFVHREEKKIE